MAHCKGDWMGQTLIECDYGAWHVQFKYPGPIVFDLEKTHPKFSKKIWQKKDF